MANTKISALTANTNPTGLEELVYAYNNANGKMTLNTMKAFVGGAGITTLNADANIWELNNGFYETEYDLYYKSGEKLEASSGEGLERKQIIFIAESDGGSRGYLAFNGYDNNTIHRGRAFFGYSLSSSDGVCYELGSRDWALKAYAPAPMSVNVDAFIDYETLVQIVNGASGTQELRLSTTYPPYSGATYTVYIDSIASGQTYTVSLGNGMSNPLGITLPSSSNKKCVITVLMTSSSTGIVTGCTIEP